MAHTRDKRKPRTDVTKELSKFYLVEEDNVEVVADKLFQPGCDPAFANWIVDAARLSRRF
jgi:hypothetical protein